MVKCRGESLLGVFVLAPCFSDDCILIFGVVSERCIELLVCITPYVVAASPL